MSSAVVGDEDEVMYQGSEVPTSPAVEHEEEIWLSFFSDLDKMGPGGLVAGSVRSPGS